MLVRPVNGPACAYGRDLPQCLPGLPYGTKCDARDFGNNGLVNPDGPTLDAITSGALVGDGFDGNGIHVCGTSMHMNNCWGGFDVYVHVHCLAPPQAPLATRARLLRLGT